MTDDEHQLTKSELRAKERRQRAEADAQLSGPARAVKWVIVGVMVAALAVVVIYLSSNHRKVGFHVEEATPVPELGLTTYRVSVQTWKSADAEDIVQGVYEKAGDRPVTVDIYCADSFGKLGVRLASGTQTSGSDQTLIRVQPDDAC